MSAEDIVANIVTVATNGSAQYKIPQQFLGAKLHTFHSYINDDLDSGSTIKIARIPPDAMIALFILRYAALGNAVTGQIGDSSDADRWVVAGGISSMAAAGQQVIMPRAGDYTLTSAGVLTAGTVGIGYVTTDWTDIILTTGGADFDGSNHRIDFMTLYSLVA